MMPELCTAGVERHRSLSQRSRPGRDRILCRKLAPPLPVCWSPADRISTAKTVKPGVKLGSGYQGNLRVPPDVMDHLRNGAVVGPNSGR